MPSIALIPNISQVHPAGQFSSLPFQQSPEDWRPHFQGIRPSSYPSPFGRFEATSFLVGRAKFDQPLAKASLALLRGLVGGALRFRWLTSSDFQSGRLQQLVQSTVPQSWPCIGLIDDEQGKVWGYCLDSILPVLAGARQTELETLEEKVRNGTRDGVIRRLLQPLKDAFQAKSAWPDGDAKPPWMRLIEKAIEQTQTAPQVEFDLRSDVRSFGPFRCDAEGGLIYLPSFSRGFVPNLAQALVRGDASQPQGSPYLEIALGDARVALVHRPSAPTLDGVVVGASPPSGTIQSSVDLGGRSVVEQMGTHIRGARDKRPPEEAPWDLSDLQRVVAVFAPELLGAARRPFISEALRQKGAVLDRAEADELVSKRQAFILTLSEEDDTCAVFVERGKDKARVGDLSMLGLALWFGFLEVDFDEDGRPHLVKRDKQFPVSFPASLEAWWRDSVKMSEAKKKLATLQRLLLAYGANTVHGGWSGLASAAVRHFIERLFESSPDAADRLLSSTRGTVSSGPALTSELRPARDPLRVSPGGH